MTEKNLKTAEDYYKAMHNKDLSAMGTYLHPDVCFLGPLASITGKAAVLEGAKNVLQLFKNLVIRAKCCSEDKVMLAYDLECPEPFGTLRVAALMTFKDDLISKIELFFDARPFGTKKEETSVQKS